MPYLLLIIALIFFTNTQAIELKISTGELPPYSYSQNNYLKGLAVEIVNTLQKRVQQNNNTIIKKPWARVISEANTSKQLSFPLARRPYRENLYKWIGPILSDQAVFVVKKANFKKISRISELKDLSVGSNLGAPTTKRLKQLNFTRLKIIPSETQLSKMFIRDRFEAWYSAELMIFDLLKKLNYNLLDVTVLYRDVPLTFYIAASLDIEDSIIAVWQKELNKMKSDGTYRKILLKYK